jgi:hypothetical protein
MIRLQSQSGVQSRLLLTIETHGDRPAIVLSAQPSRKPEGEKWVEDPLVRKQIVAFVADGRTVEIHGKVPEGEAVEIAACWRCVVEATQRVNNDGQLVVNVARVVEVWENPAKRTWAAPSHENKPATGKAVA